MLLLLLLLLLLVVTFLELCCKFLLQYHGVRNHPSLPPEKSEGSGVGSGLGQGYGYA